MMSIAMEEQPSSMIRTVRYCFCNTTVLIHFVKGIYSSLVIVIDLKKLKHLQSNLTGHVGHVGTEESGRCGQVAVTGR